METAATTHKRPNGADITFEGDHLYRITIRVEDGRSDGPFDIAAPREGLATTRAMMLTDLSLRGELVSYDVEQLDA